MFTWARHDSQNVPPTSTLCAFGIISKVDFTSEKIGKNKAEQKRVYIAASAVLDIAVVIYDINS